MFEKVEFEGGQGDRLKARVDLPEGDRPGAYALFAHCFTCSKNLKSVGHISAALTERGIGVFRFDFTGLGESQGDFADTNFSSNIEDLVAAARFMRRELAGPALLIGHSLGGAAVLRAADQIDSAVGVVTIGAPCNASHVLKLVTEHRREIEEMGSAQVRLAGRTFTIKKQFLEDLEESSMDRFIEGLNRALLILHGPLDQTVGIENAAHIFKLARHPKSFVSLDRADHLLTDERDSRYVGGLIAAWSRRYL